MDLVSFVNLAVILESNYILRGSKFEQIKKTVFSLREIKTTKCVEDSVAKLGMESL